MWPVHHHEPRVMFLSAQVHVTVKVETSIGINVHICFVKRIHMLRIMHMKFKFTAK